MGSGDGEDGATRQTDSTVGRLKPDRRAEALRANLKRRKAQARARDEGRHGDPAPAPGSDAPGRDG